MSVKRWKLTIQYDGTNYCGWQIQPDGMPTVQEEIETALYKFCQQKITLTTAGRTDSGVHAHGQVAHFDLDYGDRPITGFEIGKAINAHLRPAPIAIVKCEEVDNEFHARFDATNKLYRYRMIIRTSPPVLELPYVWHWKHKLDLTKMREAAKHLVGTHDFTSFRDSACQAKNPVRTLKRFEIFDEDYDEYGGQHIWFEIEGQSFLHHQCRNMVGTLVNVGKGKTKPNDIPKIIEAKERAAAGITAPPDGLSLVRIDYE